MVLPCWVLAITNMVKYLVVDDNNHSSVYSPPMTQDGAIGASIKELRTALGMSQVDLANELTDRGVPGMWAQTLVKIEQGKRKVSLLEGIAIADALGVEPSDLLDAADHYDDDRRVMRQVRIVLDRTIQMRKAFDLLVVEHGRLNRLLSSSEVSETTRTAAVAQMNSHGPARVLEELTADAERLERAQRGED